MKIKVGDKVRLKDKFYDEPDFKNQIREMRIYIAKNSGFELTVKIIMYVDNRKQAIVSSDTKNTSCAIPISLLEKIEVPVVQEENTIDGQVPNYNSKQQ